MNQKRIIIAIDGFSSTGKSSFAKEIAKRLGYIYADTGALYRAITYLAYNTGFINRRNTVDVEGLARLLPTITLEFKRNPSNGLSETWLNGVPVEKQIRTMEVSNKVSHIAKQRFVRNFVDDILHGMGAQRGIVMDGRDIGTVVFPDAELKIFMTASPQVRAERRLLELRQSGSKESFDSVLKNIMERDYIDTHREVAPLVQAPDAVVLDNSNMTISDQFVWLSAILLKRFNITI